MANCTLKDVAKKCGVSAYTVSRAINNKTDISEETKNKILSVAKEMGYVPNQNAKNLRSGLSKQIAIIYDDFENPYYTHLLSKLSLALYEIGYTTVTFFDYKSLSVLNTSLMKNVLSSNVSAIISLIKITSNALALNDIWKKPIIQIGVSTKHKELDCIYYDDYQGGYDLTKKMILDGKKKIGFINANTDLESGLIRISGYKQAMIDNNLKDNIKVINMANDNLSPIESADFFLNKNFDGIICYNDSTALKVLKHLTDLNVKSISVSGFDNISQSVTIPISFPSAYCDSNIVVDTCIEVLKKRLKGDFSNPVNLKLPLHIA